MIEKIIYITNAPIPSAAANAIGTMNLCSAFGSVGIDTHLIAAKTPWIRFRGSSDLYKYYGVENNFKITRLLIGPHRFGITFGFDKKALKLYAKNGGVVFTRRLCCGIGDVKNARIIYELHHEPTEAVTGKMLADEKVLRIVCISKALADGVVRNYGKAIAKKIVIAPDATNIPVTQNKVCRKKQNGKFRVGYAGSLYPGKGLEIIIQLAQKFSEVEFVVAGGTKKEIHYWQSRAMVENLKFIGRIRPSDVAKWLSGFDCLLLSNQKKCSIKNVNVNIADYTSPLKMFEYMASGVPIISSDLPVLAEILQADKDALVVDSDDIDQWVSALKRLIKEPQLSQQLAENALVKVKNYSWSARAARILEGL